MHVAEEELFLLRLSPAHPHGRLLSGSSIRLRHADIGAGNMATLDFGGLPYAIYTDKNATLIFNNMFLTGVAYGKSYVNNTRNSPYGACCSRTHNGQKVISCDELTSQVTVVLRA